MAASLPDAKLRNISTRSLVNDGDAVLIAGFIVASPSKNVVARAIGPSMAPYFSPQHHQYLLPDPTLELFNSDSVSIGLNDNWKDGSLAGEIQARGLAPTDERESALKAVVGDGSSSTTSTAVVRGKTGDWQIGLVEVYDLDDSVESALLNISTRTFITDGFGTVAGFIIGGGNGSATVLLRGIGPSLQQFSNRLQDSVLALYNSQGEYVGANDNWKDSQEEEIKATKLAPTDDREAAILVRLPAGSYTARIRGYNLMVGIGLIEIYNLR